MPNLYLERVTNSAKVPVKVTNHAACYDVRANLLQRDIIYYAGNSKKRTEVTPGFIKLVPGERVMIPTGFKMCCDPGWKIELLPRSGAALKRGLTLINCTGVVDADFRHEVMILMTNNSTEIIEIRDKERIAQLSIEIVNDIEIVLGKLPSIDSNRNGGFGSTGDVDMTREEAIKWCREYLTSWPTSISNLKTLAKPLVWNWKMTRLPYNKTAELVLFCGDHIVITEKDINNA